MAYKVASDISQAKLRRNITIRRSDFELDPTTEELIENLEDKIGRNLYEHQTLRSAGVFKRDPRILRLARERYHYQDELGRLNGSKNKKIGLYKIMLKIIKNEVSEEQWLSWENAAKKLETDAQNMAQDESA
ncbi:MAG: hypothetical protein V4440_10295 [Pseudomonadota bacterium]